MKTRPLHLGLFLAALALLLVACAQEASSASVPVYLEDTIPPCMPAGDVDVDPCEPRAFKGFSAGLASESATLEGNHPYTIRWYLGAKEAAGILASHIVVRATYLPGTVRCTEYEGLRAPTWTTLLDVPVPVLTCYADVRVNEYYLGSGPPVLTVVLSEMDTDVGERAATERRFSGRFIGQEEILFLGPSLDFAIEALRVNNAWDVQRDGDTAIAVHPWRGYWLRETGEAFRDRLEVPLADFAAAVTAAHQVRLADYGGRVVIPEFPEVEAPMVQTDANKLHDFYVEAGAMDHPDGPPGLPPPVR